MVVNSVVYHPSFPTTEDAAALAPLLLEGLVHRLNTSISAALKDDGLTPDQFRVLNYLVRRDEVPMTELATAVLIPAPTVTRIVDKLVSRALVYRSSAMNDRRRVLVHASRRGEEVHERLAPQLMRVNRDAFATLTHEQQEEFFGLLGKLTGSDS